MIKLKRAYDSVSNDDGMRFLVERLWPRGVKKTALRLMPGSRMWPPALNFGGGSATTQASG